MLMMLRGVRARQILIVSNSNVQWICGVYSVIELLACFIRRL